VALSWPALCGFEFRFFFNFFSPPKPQIYCCDAYGVSPLPEIFYEEILIGAAAMGEQDDLLYSPGYFKCERTHCRLSIEACLKRQATNREKRWAVHIECDDCPQGWEMKNQKIEKKEVSKPTQEQSVKMCQECGNKPTLHPHSTYCGSCLAKRSHAGRTRSKNAPGERKRRTRAKGKAKAKKPVEEGLDALMDLLCDHKQVLNRIRTVAEQETRPFEWQVVALLKEALKLRE
jgi:hypothetical protein